ncbi:hypothetical protein RZO07_08250 [Pseudomonas protegens]|uniref:hypothetical protein n=1 Tax=Pseudomonas TaxID=286 RepID=UPI002097186D|nr:MULTISPECIES: hypothetical protein [Pseudomonas]MCO7576788.1 hypothetical protein [Pseudomonas protegens]MCO7582718.1 hypothetical protein [Pseudomonas chlororaphis]MCO7600167.1 hypothetical protein [Pseudomonas chlororaphis]WOE81205.1 hypothetical protein RZO07_08250 [Pseudomonas protegens]
MNFDTHEERPEADNGGHKRRKPTLLTSAFANFLLDGADNRQDYVTAKGFFKPENPQYLGAPGKTVTISLQIGVLTPSISASQLLQSVAPWGITGVTHNKNASPGRRAA